MDFLVDTGATYLVLNTCKGKVSDKIANVVGATGKAESRPFLEPLNLKFGNKNLTHEFLYMPECPVSLIGRDLLSTLKV